MGLASRYWLLVLLGAVAGLGYWNYELHEVNRGQQAQIAEMQLQARAVEEVRADVMAQVEDAIGQSATHLLSAAAKVETRMASVERDLDVLQGIGYSPGLSLTLAEIESDLASVWQRLVAVETCAARTASVVNSASTGVSGIYYYVAC